MTINYFSSSVLNNIKEIKQALYYIYCTDMDMSIFYTIWQPTIKLNSMKIS